MHTSQCSFLTGFVHDKGAQQVSGLLFCAQRSFCSVMVIGGVWGGRGGGHCPPRSEPIDFVRSMNTKIFSHCLILFALSYFNEYVKA